MAKKIVILGGGTGGTLMANRLRRRYDPDEAEIHVVDQDDRHVYQPGLLFVPFGLAHADEIVRPAAAPAAQAASRSTRRRSTTSTSTRDEVHLADGTVLPYDVLIVATGARLLPEETEGLTGPGWNERVFTFYTPEGAAALARRARALRRRPARRERRRHADQVPGRAARVRLPRRLVPPRARHPRHGRARATRRRSTAPSPSRSPPSTSAGLLAEKEIELVTEFNTGEVDGAGGTLVSLRRARDPASTCSSRSRCTAAPRTSSARRGSATTLGFVPTDPHTLQSHAQPNVFAIGDATNVPTSKAGSVTHFEGEVLIENVAPLPRRRGARRRATTATPTASSRPASTRRC